MLAGDVEEGCVGDGLLAGEGGECCGGVEGGVEGDGSVKLTCRCRLRL